MDMYNQTHTPTHTRTRTHARTLSIGPATANLREIKRFQQPAFSPTWAPISPHRFTGDKLHPIRINRFMRTNCTQYIVLNAVW